MVQFVIEAVMTSFIVPLTIITFTIQDIYMIMFYDIVVVTIYIENKNNKRNAPFLGSAHIEWLIIIKPNTL